MSEHIINIWQCNLFSLIPIDSLKYGNYSTGLKLLHLIIKIRQPTKVTLFTFFYSLREESVEAISFLQFPYASFSLNQIILTVSMGNYKHNQPYPRRTVNKDKSWRPTHFHHLLISDLQSNLSCSLFCFHNKNIRHNLLGKLYTSFPTKMFWPSVKAQTPLKLPYKRQIHTEVTVTAVRLNAH